MQFFERIAREGLLFPAFMFGFGALAVIRASTTPKLTDDQTLAAPSWLRWLARMNSEKLQRGCGWAIMVFAIVIALVRIAKP